MRPGAGPRLLRGALAGVVTTLLALAFHVLGGGVAPSAPALLACLLVAVWACVLIGRARPSLPLLAAGLAVAQLALHWAFAVATGSAAAIDVPAVHAHTGLQLVGGHAGHVMWWSHVAAGLATLAVLRHGERVLARLAVLAAIAVARIAAALRRPAAPPPRRRRIPVAVRHTAPAGREGIRYVARRGPPVVVA